MKRMCKAHRCDDVAEPGRAKCLTHLIQDREYQRTWRAKQIAAGICTTCGASQALKGSRRCRDCRSGNVARANYKRRERIAAGLCVIAGCQRLPQRKPRTDSRGRTHYQMCSEHKRKTANNSARRRRIKEERE